MTRIIKGINNHKSFGSHFINGKIKHDILLIDNQFMTAWEQPDGNIVVEKYFISDHSIEMQKSNTQYLLSDQDAMEFKQSIKH